MKLDSTALGIMEFLSEYGLRRKIFEFPLRIGISVAIEG
jgi:hypothetical protein